jgi:hypothetical protein
MTDRKCPTLKDYQNFLIADFLNRFIIKWLC